MPDASSIASFLAHCSRRAAAFAAAAALSAMLAGSKTSVVLHAFSINGTALLERPVHFAVFSAGNASGCYTTSTVSMEARLAMFTQLLAMLAC